MKKFLPLFTALLIISSCSEVNIPGAGKIISLSCYCEKEFSKYKNEETECLFEDKDWSVSTINESFFEGGVTGTRLNGVFEETNQFYKLTVPGIIDDAYETGEQKLSLNRNTLQLIHETYGFIFTFSCNLRKPKV